VDFLFLTDDKLDVIMVEVPYMSCTGNF